MKQLILIAILLPSIGCSSSQVRTQRLLEIQKEVEYITQSKVECGRPPLITPLSLESYEFVVLPPLSSLGVTEVPEYLEGHLDHTWWAVDSYDFESIDRNDIDKKRLALEQDLIIEYYVDCIDEYNKRLENKSSKALGIIEDWLE